MNRTEITALAKDAIAGSPIADEQYRALLATPDHDLFALLAGADMIREYYYGREVHLCCILNGKSGRCSEDCSFCSQSAHSMTDAPVYPLMDERKMAEEGKLAETTPINRYSIVTTGKRLPRREVEVVAQALSEIDRTRIQTCASLGTLDATDMETLRAAGVTRYHHNLETASSHFAAVCTTHSYKERVDTIRAAKEAGLSVCSGGIFGIGESDDQILELAFTLKELEVDAVPINFLVPMAGTRSACRDDLTPLKCLKIIAVFRYILPDKDIFVCGGREWNLKELHPLVYHAGASGIMTGNYLTTAGRTLASDLELLDHLRFVPRKKQYTC